MKTSKLNRENINNLVNGLLINLMCEKLPAEIVVYDVRTGKEFCRASVKGQFDQFTDSTFELFKLLTQKAAEGCSTVEIDLSE